MCVVFVSFHYPLSFAIWGPIPIPAFLSDLTTAIAAPSPTQSPPSVPLIVQLPTLRLQHYKLSLYQFTTGNRHHHHHHHSSAPYTTPSKVSITNTTHTLALLLQSTPLSPSHQYPSLFHFSSRFRHHHNRNYSTSAVVTPTTTTFALTLSHWIPSLPYSWAFSLSFCIAFRREGGTEVVQATVYVSNHVSQPLQGLPFHWTRLRLFFQREHGLFLRTWNCFTIETRIITWSCSVVQRFAPMKTLRFLTYPKWNPKKMGFCLPPTGNPLVLHTKFYGI